jgi:uncharacterized damage-inducible protein DinB
MTVEDSFRDYAARKLLQSNERIVRCFELLSEEQIWHRAGEASNALGNLALHLAGNVRQWIVHGVGGAADARVRDAEFAARGGHTRGELLARLDAAVREAAEVIRRAKLDAPVEVQGYKVPAVEAIFHVVEHFSYHTGQIVFAAKAFTDRDLGFYRALNAAAKPASERTP